MDSTPQYKHLIFDLGGVLIELGDSPIPQNVLPAEITLTLQEWFSMPTAHQFERGEISPSQFANTFINELGLNISIDDFLEYFRKWPKGVYPNVESILDNLSKHYHLSVLSNCNEIHWPIMEHDFGILQHFDHCFSSHLIGLTKPQVSIFKHVLDKLNTEPEDCLFFDDNFENIQAAQNLGISAVQVRGIVELEKYLFNNCILD